MSRDPLLAVGICLIMAGLVLRGLARSARRDLARRKEHLLDDPTRRGPTQPQSTWLERNIGMIANLVLTTGVILTLAAYWRS